MQNLSPSLATMHGQPFVTSPQQSPLMHRQRFPSTPTITSPQSAISSPSVGNSANANSTSTPFTPLQLSLLKYQIVAFKLLNRNAEIPQHIIQAIIASSTFPQTSESKNEINTEPTVVAEQSDWYNSFISPYTFLKSDLTAHDHASRHHRLIIPSLTPAGLDPVVVIEEREKRLQSRIEQKLQGLEGIYEDLKLCDEEMQASNSSGNLKALIEIKALKLREKQKMMRGELLLAMNKSTRLAFNVDQSALRRMKQLSLRETRRIEHLEHQQRIDRKNRERQKHIDHLNQIVNHGRDMILAHRTHEAKLSRLGRAVINYHAHVEKEEDKRKRRMQEERLRALKNDDEEAYLKLIDRTKDTRISQLLEQTDRYLESLSQAVREQQSALVDDEFSAIDGPVGVIQKEDDENDIAFELANGKKLDYYSIAHRIQEPVTEQPTILTGGTLKEYQLKGLQWMVSLYNNRLNGILADEMGLGKTIQTISLITFLIEKKKQNGPFLIIVPLSTITNWTLEFEKWAPAVSKVVYKGPPNVRKWIQQTEIRNGNFQVLLTTYEYIIKDRPVLSKIKWVHLIIDEGHRMKNVNSKLSTVLAQYYSTRFRLILTGTPLQNNLPELWALLNFILPKVFNSVQSFDEWFNRPFANSGENKMELNEEEKLLIIKRLHKVLRPFLLRRLKKDVESELPDKVERVIKCKFSALQTRLYQQMKKHGMLYTTNEKGRTGIKGLNNTIMQLRKICNHPFVFEVVEDVINPSRTSNDLLYRVSGKFELLDRILPKLKATGHRILIFFQMTQIMNIMEDLLNYRGMRYLRLDGSTKAEDRSSLLKIFNEPGSEYSVFLLSTRAGGLGLNLQSADTVIIFDSDWNPHQDLQAQDRAHRIGQTKEVRIFRLISEKSVEETILARAQYKLDLDGKVIQAGKFDNKSTAEEREAFLRSLLEADNEDSNDFEEDLTDDDLNDIVARNDQELAIFRQMDQERERRELEEWRRRGGRGKKPERLIQDDELPDVYKNDEDPFYEDPSVYGRGHRQRGEVRYDDGLTEQQFIEALEDEELGFSEAVARRQERKRRREERKMNRQVEEEEDSVDSPPPIRGRARTRGKNRGRGRGRGRNVKGRGVSTPQSESPLSDLEDEEETPIVNRKRRNGKPADAETPSEDRGPKRKRLKKEEMELQGPDLVPPLVRQEMTRLFEKLYKVVEDLEDENHEGRKRCELFLELPSKKIYPQYYVIIQRPIAMDIINRRIHSPYYKTIAQFRDDFHLMFNNARTFNEEGSWVYVDACKLQEAFDVAYEKLCPGGQLPAAPVVVEANGNGVAISSADGDEESNLDHEQGDKGLKEDIKLDTSMDVDMSFLDDSSDLSDAYP
ncbi:uncharacterized protein VTP21DRAFT_1390 [Calcarisporiella thermophila]|uniref:uncharacterized protein n=1 Tax=Calcarisporiella thermophila TaxID=911321 RepID=UPI003742AB64